MQSLLLGGPGQHLPVSNSLVGNGFVIRSRPWLPTVRASPADVTAGQPCVAENAMALPGAQIVEDRRKSMGAVLGRCVDVRRRTGSFVRSRPLGVAARFFDD